MKQSWFLPLARLASSLSLFGILLCIHMCFILAHFLPPASGAMNVVYIFFFAGTALGAVLCPLFLPVPGVPTKTKPLYMGIGFIAVLSAVEFIFRFLGFRLWLDSVIVRSVMAVPEGMLNTACYGLFYMTWLRKTATADGQANSTGRYCSLVFGIALLVPVLVRYYSVPLMSAGIAAEDPLKGAAFIFNSLKWCMIVVGVFAAASVFLTRKATSAFQAGASQAGAFQADALQADAPLAGAPVAGSPMVKTDWLLILRLIGLASVFTILNGVMDMRALPLYSNQAIFHPNYLAVAAAVPVLGLFAGRSISRFIRRFLPQAIILFILFSCLPLFEGYPRFNMVLGTLIAIGHYTVWMVFTTAVVELYSGGFWFYGASTVIFFSVVFAFLAPVIGPYVPDGTEYRVLYIVIAAVLFMLLSFRWILFPRLPFSLSALETSNLENIFKERGLSKREIDVANLLVKEGLGKLEIGERLFITPGTVKIHISNIYQKFNVKTRAEFMALFVKGEKA
jgi:DNA-binding CsgD family transcriptional regulator